MAVSEKKVSSTVLIAATRNEGPFLLEWIAYHRLIGFKTIVLFDIGSTDGSKQLLTVLHSLGIIEYVDYCGPENKAVTRAQAWSEAFSLQTVQAAGWIMALDVTDFFVIHPGLGHLDDLFNATEGADIISPCVRLFGNGGRAKFTDKLITQNNIQASPGKAEIPRDVYLNATKNIARRDIVLAFRPNRPVLKDGVAPENLRWLDGSGNTIEEKFRQSGWGLPVGTLVRALCEVHQYKVRNTQSFIMQEVLRILPATEHRPQTAGGFRRVNTNQEWNPILLRHGLALSSMIEDLKKIKDVDAAHLASVNAHNEAIEKMTEEFLEDSGEDEEKAKLIALLDAPSLNLAGQQADAGSHEDAAPRWLMDLRRSEFTRGFYQSFGSSALQYTKRSSDTLIVSFDNLAGVYSKSAAREPWGYGFYRGEGWSHLGVMAFERHWFRDNELFDYLEGLAKDGFFSGFKNIVFTGTSMGAYAAAAFSDLAPGSTVVAFSPQSTLKPKLVPWEDRYSFGQEFDWTGRYADAPKHCRKARQVYVVYDPYFDPDTRHAERFDSANVMFLRCRFAGHMTALFLRKAGILQDVMRLAVNQELTSTKFYSAYRQRRIVPLYFWGLSNQILASKRHDNMQNRLINWVNAIGKPYIANMISKNAKT